MVSSFSVFFIVAFYFYFKQHYSKLISAKINNDEQSAWNDKLRKKLMIFPAGIIAIVLLYAISYTLMNLYPDVDNVKSSRRVVDVVATLMCLGVFIFDKREIDRRLHIKKLPQPPVDKNEPGIDIPEPGDVL